MINKRFLLIAAPLALVACGDNASEPTGQVLATVNGEEITATDVDAELAGATAPTPEAQKELQRRALDNIINRTILAQAAVEDGLDKGPEAAVLERKAKQAALVQLLQRKTSESLPKPAADEIDAFVSDNPDMFSQRKIYVVDQIIVPQATPELARALQPVQSMDEAMDVLTKRGVKPNKTVGVIDSMQMPPAAAKQIAALPPSEVFIIPANGALRINHVRSSQTDPISGDQARRVASEMLSGQRMQEGMQQSLAQRIQEGRKNVKYNEAFAPPPEETASPNAAPAASGVPATGQE